MEDDDGEGFLVLVVLGFGVILSRGFRSNAPEETVGFGVGVREGDAGLAVAAFVKDVAFVLGDVLNGECLLGFVVVLCVKVPGIQPPSHSGGRGDSVCAVRLGLSRGLLAILSSLRRKKGEFVL